MNVHLNAHPGQPVSLLLRGILPKRNKRISSERASLNSKKNQRTNPMSEFLEYVKEEAEMAKQHELQLFQLLISQTSSSQFQSQSHNQNFHQNHRHQQEQQQGIYSKIML